MAVSKRPPHLLPGQSNALRSQSLLDSPLELWHADIASRGIFSAEKLAALAIVLGIIFSQVSFIQTAAEAAPDEITGTVFEDIAGDGLADGAVGGVHNPGAAGVPVSLFRDEATAQTADISGEVGQYASIAIGSDGNPVVAYGDMSNGDLKVLHCDDPSCSTFTTTVADSVGSVGQSVSLAIGADGFPVISHYDWGNLDLKVTKCNNLTCSSRTTNTVDSVGSQGNGSSIAIGTDGLPIISYFDGTAYDLKVAHCNDAACATATITAIDTASTTGAWSSIAIGSDGLAVVSYKYIPSADIKVAHCSNVACTSGTSTTVDTAGDVGGSSSIAQGSDGFPAVAYFDLTNRDLKFAHCTNLTCTTKNITTVETDDAGFNPSIAIGLDGNPIIAHYNSGDSALQIDFCDNLDCTSSTTTQPDSAGNVGTDPSIVLTAGGSPVVAYQDQGNYDLKILTAANGLPDAGDTPIATTTTDVNGAYAFAGLSAGDYLVAVESTAIGATAGYDTAQGDSWAEQTYGSSGSLCANGSGGTLARSTAGACYGGVDATSSDIFDSDSPDVTDAEHVAGIVAGAASANFGFSFNVVTNTEGGDTRDADPAAERTVQGSMRQFIQNANAVTGANAMRFVPAEPTNDGTWWEVAVSDALPSITGSGTTIDGTAHDLTDGTTGRNTNGGFLGSNAGGGVTVGVDDVALPQVAAPELEIDSADVTSNGIEVRADNVTIRDLAIYGFGSTGTNLTDGDIAVPSGFSVGGLTVEGCVIGTSAGSFTDPGAAGSDGSGVALQEVTGVQSTIQDNLFGYLDELAVSILSSDTVVVSGNEVLDAGQGSNLFVDAMSAESASSNIEFSGNLIDGAPGNGVSFWETTGSHLVSNNTIQNVGTGGEQTAGIMLFGAGSTIERNRITSGGGPGVIVVGENPPGGFYAFPAATSNRISRNEFGSNAGNAIDLTESSDSDVDHDQGDGVTLAPGTLATTGNDGLDAPVIGSATTTTVSGTSCASCDVEVYKAVSGAGDGGYGEGVEYLGTATADGGGSWSLTGITGLAGGDDVSAIAIDGSNNTSEFGLNAIVTGPFVVNSTADAGDDNPGDGVCETATPSQCTLRAAIEEANAFPGTDTINFNIPTGDAGYTASPVSFTIQPQSLLPAISTPMVLDASTQPENSTANRPVVEVDGADVSAGEENGFYLTGGGATVRGFVINNWGDDAIDVEFNDGNTIVGNYIGTNVTGTAAKANAWGINLKTANNIIGGTSAADRNVVSGNLYDGFYIYNATATGNLIQGNYIGTNAAGTAGLANGSNGLYIWSGAHDNTIGGATAAHGNVISGNGTGEAGIFITGSTTSANLVQNNYIGTNAAGDAAIPNNLHGIRMTNAPDTQILDNLISGNDVHGVYVYDADSTGTQILRNIIGTNAAIDARLDNLFDGVRLEGNSSGTIVGSPGNGNVIAGNTQHGVNVNSAADNTIQGNFIGTDPTGLIDLGNTLSGVYFASFAPSSNLVEGNKIAFNAEGITVLSGWDNALVSNDIYFNDSLGIDLDDDDVSSNDGGDGDSGPNDMLNFPVIASATEIGGIVTVGFDLDVPDGNYRVELFSNTAADGSGYGEGESYVDFVDVAVTGGVPTPASTTIAGSAGDIITATATEGTALPFGSTSEFSAAFTVTSGGFVVNSTGDAVDVNPGDGVCETATPSQCTLRAAIEEANAFPGTDTINFNIPTSEPGYSASPLSYTIQIGVPSTEILPAIAEPVTIDGTSQPGFTGTPIIVLDGTAATTIDTNGITLEAGSSTIRGLVIVNFSDDAIELDLSGGNTIAGNYLGVLPDGTTPSGNGWGVAIKTSGNTIGGTDAADRNVISANSNYGLSIYNSSTSNLVQGNYIGTTAAGDAPLGNGAQGVFIEDSANLNTIGGATAAHRNVISSNGTHGVEIKGVGTDSNDVIGNYIGTDAAGTADLGNGGEGINITSSAQGNAIGGTAAGERNIISGNSSDGIFIAGGGTDGNSVIGNYIGVDVTGAADLGNGGDGISILIDASDNTVGGTVAGSRNVISANNTNGIGISGSGTTLNKVIGNYIGTTAAGDAALPNNYGVRIFSGASGNSVGGTVAGSGNLISGNTVRGVMVDGSTSLNNAILGNSIVDNAGLGIELGIDGVTANDPGDGDSGANDLLNFPVITSATESGGSVTLGFDLDVPDGNYRIEFFTNTAADGTGYGEGETYVDSVTVSVSGGVPTPASHTFAGSAGDIVTATATEGIALPFGSTSEFSAATTVTVPSSPPVLNAIAPQPGSEGSSTTFTASATDPDGPSGLTFTLVDGPVDAVPSGASINPTTGAFSWVPNEAQGPGVHEFYVRVTDPTALFDQQLVTFTISEVNAWPVLDPIGNQATDEQTLLTFTATASDTDIPANTLTFSLSGQPAGSSIDPVSGVFTWTPTEAQGPNVYTFDVVLTDDGSPTRSNLETIDVTVSENDLVAPVITLTGANPQSIEVGSAYVELGATALDDVDGDISGSIAINSAAVNTSVLGSYSVTYDVADASGNAAVQASRTVNVVDTTAPAITLLGANPQTIEVGSAYVELGATASDSHDGDLTGTIVINSSAVNTAVVGSYAVTYDVVDSSGNPANGFRTVDVVDTTAPVITLLGSNPQMIEVGTAYTELGATASDNYDGDISGSIVINSSAVNTAVIGFYSVTYNVTDSEGNAATQVIRTVDVVDSVAPIITLLGANPQVIEVGTAYAELGATAFDVGDGDLSGSIVIDPSAVNIAVVGSYSVTYDVADSQSNAAIQVARTVDVVDTTLPVITVVGVNPQTIEVGAGHTELGATAVDNYDGDISGSIVIDSTAVNTAVVGSYSVTYDVTDSQGNAAVTVTRTVDVVDTTAPVITLTGANPQTIEVGTAYSELGATASDVGDGDLTSSIVVDSTAVNTAVVGSYSVTYDVTDSEGNAAVQVTRTVDVVDTTAPVITLVGANPQTIQVGTAYSELGATASDNYDGDISGSIVINTAAVNTGVVGSYVVTYDVVDSSGNPANGFRIVNVVDTTIPVISLLGSNPQIIEVGTAYTELGATALDNYDGDISGAIAIDATAVNTAIVGSYVVTYDVTDSEGNSAIQVTRTVDVADTSAPIITLVGANPQAIEVGTAYPELGATAFDVGDGDLTSSIVIDAAAVNTVVVGAYVVTYDVTDSESNAAVQVTRTVNVVDTTIPVITLLGASPQTIEVGTAYAELGASAVDNYDGDITGSIVIDATSVNTALVGSYLVTYDVTDSEGNTATQVTRIVDVVDTTAPVITLVGGDPQVIEVGSAYAELGATAVDNYDGDITGSIVIDATSVNTALVGSYLVTYDVTDSEGNTATQVTRTVDVVDTTAPVITLLGANPQVIEVGAGYSELGATALDNYDGDISGSIVVDATAVNAAVVGSYVVTYDVTDSEGNSAPRVSRTVDVVDTAIPIITLSGANPQTIEVGIPYVELGATAIDIGDGDLTSSIVVDTTAVNTSVVGSYLVTYDVTDSQANPAVQVTRTVDVVDTTVPVITLLGINPQSIEVGTGYSELGATAFDNYDGDITGSVAIDATSVNTALVGSYLVTYDVTDSQANPAVQMTRTVDVVDTTAPVITLLGANPQTIEVGTAYTELGATALDNYDGDITGSVVVDTTAVNTAVVGSYVVTYDVIDSEGNAATQVTRTVDVVDTTAPTITLIGATPQVIEVGSPYVELGATALDNYDGDVTGSIVINSAAVNTVAVGTYIVTYDVVDGSGNPAFALRTVNVVDTTAPVITLVGSNPQVIQVGSPYVEMGATAVDNHDGDITGSVVIDATAVDTAVLGSYIVTYDVTDIEGNTATQVMRTVDVVDTTAPVITLVGANPQSVVVGSPYLELGATATDNFDGDITGLIVTDATAVDTAVVGSYLVTYDVTDSQGNAAVQAIRTVNVLNAAPTLGLVLDQTTDEGALLTFTASATDPDPADTLTFSLSGAPVGASITAGGAFSWTPTEMQGPGAYSFEVVVTDAGAPPLSDLQTFAVTVGEINVAPVLGAAGPYAVDEQAPLAFSMPASDSDLPANGLSFALSGAPAGASITAGGAFSWTPTEAQGPGVYVFDVTVADDGSPGLSDVAPITVTVGEINAAPSVASPGDQSSSEADAISLTISATDPDIPANAVSYSATGLPDGLTIDPVTGEITGVIAYSAHAASPYTTTITVADTGIPSRNGAAVFNWSVADTNRAPVGSPDTASGPEDTTITVPVVANDTDPDGDPISVSSVTQPSHGSASATGGGVQYTPEANYFGPDTFTYVVTDGRGGSDTVAVSVTVTPVNDAPSLTGLTSLRVAEGTLATFVAIGSDPDGDRLAFSLAGAPAGAAIDAASGTFTWTSSEAQGPGSYTFDVAVTDDGIPSLSAARSVTIDILEVNEAPVVVDPGDQVSAENDTVSFRIAAGDPDIPSNSLRFAAAGLPPGLSINPVSGVVSGVVPFDAAVGSPYAVTVTATDDGSPQRSGQATFDWQVRNTNRPPTAFDFTLYVEAGVPTTMVLNGSDPDGDRLSFSIANDPAQGALSGGPRLYDYTASPDASGTDEFTFVVSDGALQATGTVTVDITANLAPVGGADEYTLRRGGVLVVDAPGLLGNDRDPEGRSLTAQIGSYPQHGSLTLRSDGSIVYRNRNENVAFDAFSYVANDGMRVSELIAVVVELEDNIAPAVRSDEVRVNEDTSIVFNPLTNDYDANDESLQVANASIPANGSLEWSGDGVFEYEPDPDWNGTESITYRATDGDLVSSGTITVTVVPVNDAPTAAAAEVTGNSGETVIVDLRPYVADVDGDLLTFLLESPAAGSAVVVEPGVFEISLEGVVRDLASLTFVVADPDGEKASSALTVVVRIPAELIGVPSLVGDDIGGGSGPGNRPTNPDEPGSTPLLSGLRLMVGSVLDTFQAIRVPLLIVFLIALGSLYLGFSRRFAFSSAATALPMTARKRVDIVMSQSGAGVQARTEPGSHESVAHRFGPDETGILTTGARSMMRGEVWVEVETPEGDAWVNSEFLTEQVPDAVFVEDSRPHELVADLVDQMYRDGDLLTATSGHDLHVAYYGPPVRFAANSLKSLLRGASVYWWWQPEGDTPRHQGTFDETVGESLTAAYRYEDAHLREPDLPIPREFVNMQSLAVGTDDYNNSWRIFFRYEEDEPSIAGLMREAAPNPAAVHGRIDMQAGAVA